MAKSKKRRHTKALSLVPVKKEFLTAWKAILVTNDTNARRIVNQIIAEVADSISANGKNVGNGAFSEWRPELHDAVLKNLNLGADWAADESNVLSVAWDMGTISALLASANTHVAKSQVHAAFNAVQQSHTVCSGNMGGGTWCDFSM